MEEKSIIVDILGTTYNVYVNADEEMFPQLKHCDGYTDPSLKKIVIAEFGRDEMSIGDLEWYTAKVVRHEIIHAFLFESGLAENSHKTDNWATNEEMVDFFAIQLPKIVLEVTKVYNKMIELTEK